MYLLGRTFSLVTDHSALQWLHSVEPKGRLVRWIMILQEYSFTIQHRPGIAHGNADGLSRLPSTNASTSCSQSTLNCTTIMSPGYNLSQAQLSDSSISKIIEMLSAEFPKPSYFVWAKDPAFVVSGKYGISCFSLTAFLLENSHQLFLFRGTPMLFPKA